MKFKDVSETEEINGSCLQGYITCDYDTLVEVFGEPGDSDGYKVDAEWCLKFEDGTIATIYNWKNGKNYCGSRGKPVKDITDWNIGGFNGKAKERVHEALIGGRS